MMRNTPATDMRVSVPSGTADGPGRFVRDAGPPRDEGNDGHARDDALRKP